MVIFIYSVRWPLFLKNGHLPQNFSPFSPKMLLFLRKLLNEKIFKTSFPIKKGYIHFPCQVHPSLQKRLGPQKWFFAVFSENTAFLWKKLLNNKIFNPYLWLKKSHVNFWRKEAFFPKKLSNAPPKQFFTIFSGNTVFFQKNCWPKKYSASNFW